MLLVRLAMACSAEPYPCGLFPACTSTEHIIRYGDAGGSLVSNWMCQTLTCAVRNIK